MKKILEGSSRRAGTIFGEIDTNFIEVCNSIMRIAYPDYTLKDYAGTQPADPAIGDCYLVKETGTVWGFAVEKDDILHFEGMGSVSGSGSGSASGSASGSGNGGVDWEILPYKITEINAALQFFYFDASNVAIDPVAGLVAVNTQQAIAELTAVLVAAGLIVLDGSGSGSGV